MTQQVTSLSFKLERVPVCAALSENVGVLHGSCLKTNTVHIVAARLITQIYHRMKGLPSPDAMPPAREDIPTAGYARCLLACHCWSSNDQDISRRRMSLLTFILSCRYLQTSGDAPLVPPRPGLPNGAASQSGARSNTQIRCICGINNDRGTMIQCEVCHSV